MATPSLTLITRHHIVAETRDEYYVQFVNSARPTDFIRPRWLPKWSVNAAMKQAWEEEKQDKDFLDPVPIEAFHSIESKEVARRLLKQVRGFFSPYGREAWARTGIEDQRRIIKILVDVASRAPSSVLGPVAESQILIAGYMVEELNQLLLTSSGEPYEPAFVNGLRHVEGDHRMAFTQDIAGGQHLKGAFEFATPHDAQVAVHHNLGNANEAVAALSEANENGVVADHLQNLKVCFVPKAITNGSAHGTRMPIPLSKLLYVQRHHPLSESITTTDPTLVTAYDVVDYMPHKLFGACLLWVISVGGLSHNKLLDRLEANKCEVERSNFRHRRRNALRILNETRTVEFLKYYAILNLELDQETASENKNRDSGNDNVREKSSPLPGPGDDPKLVQLYMQGPDPPIVWTSGEVVWPVRGFLPKHLKRAEPGDTEPTKTRPPNWFPEGKTVYSKFWSCWPGSPPGRNTIYQKGVKRTGDSWKEEWFALKAGEAGVPHWISVDPNEVTEDWKAASNSFDQAMGVKSIQAFGGRVFAFGMVCKELTST